MSSLLVSEAHYPAFAIPQLIEDLHRLRRRYRTLPWANVRRELSETAAANRVELIVEGKLVTREELERYDEAVSESLELLEVWGDRDLLDTAIQLKVMRLEKLESAKDPEPFRPAFTRGDEGFAFATPYFIPDVMLLRF
jgi:hypothetical protein